MSRKKIFSMTFAALLMVSMVSFAQMQNPVQIGGKEKLEEAIRLSQTTIIAITISSLSKAYDYEITVDGDIVDTTGLIKPNTSRKIQIPLRFLVAGKPQTFEICSISIPSSNDEFVRTRVCTQARLIWFQ